MDLPLLRVGAVPCQPRRIFSHGVPQHGSSSSSHFCVASRLFGTVLIYLFYSKLMQNSHICHRSEPGLEDDMQLCGFVSIE
uniref:Uncharacterized protein n=1 Tax=Physcomitrium patens TaxID=3218 RepID=A0A2K1IQW6_PHYPA|nr:hypothetical protein PHYPA_025793 [Physcomitrium patens]